MIFKRSQKQKLSDGAIRLELVQKIKNEPAGPVFIYDIIREEDGMNVGRCDLRMGMNEELYYAGNIGYTVYLPYRSHHYAQHASTLLFDVARANKMKEVLITCSPENLASKRTCEALGCEFIEECDVPTDHYLYRQGEPVKRIYRKIL